MKNDNDRKQAIGNPPWRGEQTVMSYQARTPGHERSERLGQESDMKNRSRIILTALAVAMLAGCSREMAGTSRSLGVVPYGEAFAVGKQVMSNFFSVASADIQSGRIRSRPRRQNVRSERLVTGMVGMAGSPARRLATLSLHRSGGAVVAYATVEVQRQDSAIHRQRSADLDNYDSVPNRTPAELEAATTPEQNELWRTCRRDRAMEEKILSALYVKLSPARHD